jgi:hypothetical protein
VTALPAPVAAVCATFLAAVPDGLVTGLYLRGGLAFGDWVPGKSDVDFTATLSRRPGPDEIAALRAAHDEVAVAHGDAPFFDGSHLLTEDLRRSPAECPDVPRTLLHDFAVKDGYDPVGWHELARHGVTVCGPPVESLSIWTDEDLLRRHTIDNLDTYWREWARRCATADDVATHEWTCEWVVPGIARLDHLLVTGQQTSKSRAVRWGLSHYPERFHRVLRESLAIREEAFEPQYEDVPERGRDVATFASYVVERATL